MSRPETSSGWAPPSPSDTLLQDADNAPPPLSKAAVAGFVCALAVFVPLLTQALGFFFGVVGLFKTRHRRRRGRGMAIAALPISIIVGTLWTVAIAFAWLSLTQIKLAERQVLGALRASSDERSMLLASLYDERMSAAYKARVDRARFETWAESLRQTHGQLQEWRRDPSRAMASLGGGRLETRYIGEFVNGAATVSIQYPGLLGGSLQLDDIRVDGRGASSD